METDEIYTDLSFEDYAKWPGASSGRLKRIAKSPAHSLFEDSEESSSAQRIGTLVHLSLLEPDKFLKLIPYPKMDKRTTEGKTEWARLLKEFGESFLIDLETYVSICAMRDAVLNHESANKIIEAATLREASIKWAGANGVPRKARLDMYCPSLELVADIKTTTDASRSAFTRQIFSMGYHIQAAHYLDAINHFDKPASNFVFICVEKDPQILNQGKFSHAVAVYRFTAEALTAGKVERDRLLKIYDSCFLSKSWPGYSDKVLDIAIPQWALNEINERHLEVTEDE